MGGHSATVAGGSFVQPLKCPAQLVAGIIEEPLKPARAIRRAATGTMWLAVPAWSIACVGGAHAPLYAASGCGRVVGGGMPLV